MDIKRASTTTTNTYTNAKHSSLKCSSSKRSSSKRTSSKRSSRRKSSSKSPKSRSSTLPVVDSPATTAAPTSKTRRESKQKDTTTTTMRSQATFSGTAKCETFDPNPMRPSICRECFKHIFSHKSDVVIEDEMIRVALEYSQKGERTPSLILPSNVTEGIGALFLGGFRAILNKEFLAQSNVTSVVNTAAGLEMFGPKYINGKAAAIASGVVFLEMGWVDDHDQVLDVTLLMLAVKIIHEARQAGGSVLVHCAQGKSRSTTVVVAYMCTVLGLSPEEALTRVQQSRAMAQPNPNFWAQLQAMYKNKVFQFVLVESAVGVYTN